MTDTQVAIVGAGPYGLSIAAHLKRIGVPYRIFGVPMQSWRMAMPAGMILKSDGMGSNLSDPEEKLSLGRYCLGRDLPYCDHGLPIPLQTFVDYGLHFQQQLVPEVEECRLLELAGKSGHLSLQLDTGENLQARNVVLAVGTACFARLPEQFAGLPRELVTHSSCHRDLSRFQDKEVIVIGGGQAALETAALLSEQGARVQVLVRSPLVEWNPDPKELKGERSRFELQTALGAGWKPWFYSHMQGAFRHLPLRTRTAVVRRALGPAGAWWLRDRVLGRFPVLCSHVVQTAREDGGRISLSVARASGGSLQLSADHVLVATGYKVDVDALPFLSAELSRSIRREGTGPRLSSDYQSSVGGLYFTGLASAHSFGPSMRFVFGADFAARKIARSLQADRRASIAAGWRAEEQAPPDGEVSPGLATQSKTQINAPVCLETSTAAVVISFSEYPFHQGSLGVIRSLGSLGVAVYAVQRSRSIPSSASRYLRGKFPWKTNPRNVGCFLEGMKDLAQQLARPAVLVPADDLSAILIAENAEELPREFTFARPPAHLPRSVANKQSLHNLREHLGMACPSAEFPSTGEELLQCARRFTLPAVVKVVEPWLAPHGFKSTVIISERPQLVEYCENFARQETNTRLMLQEMIPAAEAEDWFVHGYCDQQANPAAVFTGVKLRSYPAFAGPTTFGMSVGNDALRAQSVRLLKSLGYKGVMDLDYRFDRRDGRYKLVDFNPRIGAQFRIFKTPDGTDVVRALYRDLTGQAFAPAEQIEGRTFISEITDLLASCTYRKSAHLGLSGWWNSVRGVSETAWFAADDPLPFLFMSLYLPFRALARALSLNAGGFRSGRPVRFPYPAQGQEVPPQ